MGAKQQANAKAEVQKKLQELATRVPGRVTAPATADKRTLIAGQLVKITPDEVFIQLDQDTYGIPVTAIEEIREIKNPVEVERVTGVDVVVTVSNRATVQTRVADLVRKSEVPFALVNPQIATAISEKDREVLRARTERWLKLNGLVLGVSGEHPGSYDTATCQCSAMTQQGAGNMTCDTWDRYPEMSLGRLTDR